MGPTIWVFIAKPSLCQLSSPAALSRSGDLYGTANEFDEKTEAM